MFELKKILTALFMPLPLLLILGFIGLGFIMFSRYQKLGVGFSFFALLGIFISSFQPITTPILRHMEQVYPRFSYDKEPIQFILVLGSGHQVNNQIPLSSTLSRNGLMRLVEGIRLQHLYPHAKLILSGDSNGTNQSNAQAMANVATAIGIPKSSIILLPRAANTQEEAKQVAKFTKNKPLALVTSAHHMPRAMQAFKEQGLNPIPAPTNYLTQKQIHQALEKYTPKSKYLEQTERFWYEFWATQWQKYSS